MSIHNGSNNMRNERVISTMLPLICTSLIVISATFVGFGWAQIMKGNREKHQKLMLIGAACALLFFILYVCRTIFVGNTSFAEDAPIWIRDAYFIFLIFHILLATVSGIFGIVTILHAFNKRFAKHKKIGRWTAIMWLATAPTGVLVYLLLYVFYPGGETKPVIDVILGG